MKNSKSSQGLFIHFILWTLFLLTGCSSTKAHHTDYHIAFRHAAQTLFSDPVQFHDPHGLKTLGIMRDELVKEFGQEQFDKWLNHAIAEACLVKTDESWACAYVFQPDLPEVPSCGFEPSLHFTSELILGVVWNNLEELRRPGFNEELVVPLSDMVRWLQSHIAIDEWSPGMETQALTVACVPLNETWQSKTGEIWDIAKLLDAVIARWYENSEKTNLKVGDIVPENMLHLAPALIAIRRFLNSQRTNGKQ